MTNLVQVFKLLVTLATLLTSAEAILKLARFAWNLALSLTKNGRRLFKAGRFVRRGFRFA
ncbi:MAG: hypothetical protein MH204_05720 [Fimbriimonadaceae bacterium]|nr:hypothetical protein [Fimbriimonadaceae bacterium]